MFSPLRPVLRIQGLHVVETGIIISRKYSFEGIHYRLDTLLICYHILSC